MRPGGAAGEHDPSLRFLRPTSSQEGAPSELTRQEGRTAGRAQGRRHRAAFRCQLGCPRLLPTVAPTLPVARTRISSPCTPVQCRKGCYHRRGSHSGQGHSGTGLASHAAEGPTLVGSLPSGQGPEGLAQCQSSRVQGNAGHTWHPVTRRRTGVGRFKALVQCSSAAWQRVLMCADPLGL